jgi:hypothetical protein
MFQKFIFFAVIILLTAGCKKEQSKSNACIEQFLELKGLTPYDGETLACQTFYTRFELDGESYFQIGNHCADVYGAPENCAGEPYCTFEKCPELAYFYENAVEKEIVGFKN